MKRIWEGLAAALVPASTGAMDPLPRASLEYRKVINALVLQALDD